ncbi:hypothetical protein P7K49_037794 [Saguinus oedipus]|uniref:Uncharacterized protein n=1 Tax=Saguinus oedipus TaxID=9490 RepID=A0ABQ9TJ62_SAGOE|nr:hypothetical protein P7K49_037794 [Saguinus oedipus]
MEQETLVPVEFLLQVSKIVDAIYKQLRENCFHNMKCAMLRVITLLTRTSPKKVIFQLMDYPVPADDTLVQMWQAAGSEATPAPHILKTILLILKGKPGEMEDSLTEKKRFPLDATNMMALAASQALCTFLPLGSYKKAVAQFFPQLLMALMFQVFYSSELRLMPTNRTLYAQDALRVLLNCSGLQQVDITLMKNSFWNHLSQDLRHHYRVYLLAKTLSYYNFPQFPETLCYLYKLSVEGPRRSEDSIIVVIFLTELLNNFFKEPFPEVFLVLFRKWINDSNPVVSKLSLRRIAYMSPANEIENVSSLLIAILDAFLSKDETVVLQALLTLRTLLPRLDKVIYSSFWVPWVVNANLSDSSRLVLQVVGCTWAEVLISASGKEKPVPQKEAELKAGKQVTRPDGPIPHKTQTEALAPESLAANIP